ncbi:hypothetical protein [Lysinibacillus sp. NPDC056232]
MSKYILLLLTSFSNVFCSESKASATNVFCTESVATGTEVSHFYRW